MNPYYSGQSGNPNQQSLSSTTDPSRYQHSLASANDPTLQYQASGQVAGYQSQTYASQMQPHPYHPSSGYANVGVPHPSYQSPQYSQMPAEQQNVYSPQAYGQHSPAFPAAGSRSGQYSGGPPASPTYGSSSYAPAHPAQYGLVSPAPHPSAPQATRYIPTPAQSMQSYAYGTGRGGASGSNIVLPPPASPSPGIERYQCDRCDRTFSRPHDRKRHYESQHMLTSHTCQYCRKDFSRADSLKRHLDNGCDKAPGP
ncbi:predicted protein [Postia placenta Mad-698-R]|uniref:C2H2-type domain-containing protein n=1 Tax=Postia placenta MAD-698-R-SB12 TaxID=670580 RepID=A0A1X6NBM5_9APHY|nr:hypothetical protein POSPLADRAFT_1130863 [Postia placenta MAD-698-R-SB12]EED82052.1 predicted protein [Postia placenta Mad-698-R]OSX65783.1 hypothetical protein POSPLADRAFT_1130863 [Postia placenta MAD-698-R-SB12]